MLYDNVSLWFCGCISNITMNHTLFAVKFLVSTFAAIHTCSVDIMTLIWPKTFTTLFSAVFAILSIVACWNVFYNTFMFYNQPVKIQIKQMLLNQCLLIIHVIIIKNMLTLQIWISYFYIYRIIVLLFPKKTDFNSERYRNWQYWNLHDPVLTGLSIGRNLQKPIKNHGLHEIIMMT